MRTLPFDGVLKANQDLAKDLEVKNIQAVVSNEIKIIKIIFRDEAQRKRKKENL